MNDFEKQFEWQAQYAQQVVRIVAPYLITVADPEVDCKENGDFQISFPRNGTIGCRLRTPEYAKYTGDVTFRSQSKNGGKTEISKIIEGYGDYFFYGHVDKADNIWHWYLLCFQSLRAMFMRKRKLLDREQRKNSDGTAFLVFSVEDELTDAIVAKQTNEAMPRQPQLI